MPRGGLSPASALLTSITTPPSRTRAKIAVDVRDVLLVRDREDQRVEAGELLERRELDLVLLVRLARVAERIVDHRVDAVLRELGDDVRDLRVAQVGHVLLERQAEDADLRLAQRHVELTSASSRTSAR